MRINFAVLRSIHIIRSEYIKKKKPRGHQTRIYRRRVRVLNDNKMYELVTSPWPSQTDDLHTRETCFLVFLVLSFHGYNTILYSSIVAEYLIRRYIQTIISSNTILLCYDFGNHISLVPTARYKSIAYAYSVLIFFFFFSIALWRFLHVFYATRIIYVRYTHLQYVIFIDRVHKPYGNRMVKKKKTKNSCDKRFTFIIILDLGYLRVDVITDHELIEFFRRQKKKSEKIPLLKQWFPK